MATEKQPTKESAEAVNGVDRIPADEGAKSAESAKTPESQISEAERESFVDEHGVDPAMAEAPPTEGVDDLSDPADLDQVTQQVSPADLAGSQNLDTDKDFGRDGNPSYDEAPADGPDVELIDESMLHAAGPVGGLDGRNDAADGVTGGPGTFDDPLPDVGDPRAAAGDSLHEITQDKITAIMTNDSLSHAEKQDALDQLDRQNKFMQGAADADPGFDATATTDTTDTATPEGGAPDVGTSSEAKETTWLEDIDGWLEFFGLKGDAGDAGGTGGVIGGAGNEEILKAAGMTGSGVTSQKEAEAAAEKEIASQEAPSDGKAETQDLDPEQGLTGPDLWGDFSDDYRDGQRTADTGGDIDYGDDGDPGGGYADPADADADVYTADYGEEYRGLTEDDLAGGEARAEDAIDPSDEFFDV